MRIISGEYRGRTLKTCIGPGYRPAMAKVRESVFSMLESMGISWPCTRVIDVFAGSGSLGFECISRGASKVLFIEKSLPACNVIRKNLELLRVPKDKASVIKTDAVLFLKKGFESRFNLAFIDPPYGQNLLIPALTAILEGQMLKPDSLVCVETEITNKINPAEITPITLLKDKNYGQTRILIWKKN